MRGDHELQLRGDFLPLGFLAVKPDEDEDEAVEDLSALDGVTCLKHKCSLDLKKFNMLKQ